MDYKDGKWAKEILGSQQNDGSWGNFHCFAIPNKNYPITTGQALRRLAILGFTINDLPIKKAVNYMNSCLVEKNNALVYLCRQTETYKDTLDTLEYVKYI